MEMKTVVLTEGGSSKNGQRNKQHDLIRAPLHHKLSFGTSGKQTHSNIQIKKKKKNILSIHFTNDTS